MQIETLYRYPVKGLSPERVTGAVLTAGGFFPGDRLFAIENGPSGFDPAAPVHQPKIKYLMLMRNAALARLKTRYDDANGDLVIHEGGEERLRAATATEEGRAAITRFFEGFMQDELRGPPKLLTALPPYRFTDSLMGFVSIINLASIADLEGRLGRPIDPLRFRGNLMVGELGPWVENDLVGREIAGADGLRLQVVKRIVRCAATNVDPETGARDMQIPDALMRHYGHVDCGVYCRVLAGGTLSEGDGLTIVEHDSA
ncbi:MOSC N-terminal beta barrel domain-containing protein [Bosea sp. (in: a-proteobacteria)]|uniref:MOSC domain-containing protein n=1 Tax=Bosea sp. (in: a-proteobacteria) TaxID=1871050 RepID=UPI00260FBD99|nr:MOSC N-terminal beta barrel domain-containing protein [Bosea sp. (in: a-proteobacteria)]MCO5091820.1 MOSC domain-containing protein [Bosea sp. (in: a-proteobacteria)]